MRTTKERTLALQKEMKAAGFDPGPLDGIMGDLTLSASADYSAHRSGLLDLATVAARDIGLQESPRGSNRGPGIRKFFEADDLVIGGQTDGYAWCASAVSYWVQEYLDDIGNPNGIKPPRIAAVAIFPVWAKQNNLPVLTSKPQRGDIVVFQFSHIGVVRHVDLRGILTIEGNTNDEGSREGYEVAARRRKLSECKLFIRID